MRYAIFINANANLLWGKRMTENELVKLMDEYMGNSGYYMKPRIESDRSSFFMAKGSALASDVHKSFDAINDALGEKENKEPQLFSGTPIVECAVCADVPNLSTIDCDDEL